MEYNVVRQIIIDAKYFLDRSQPKSFEEKDKLYDDTHEFMIKVGEAKDYLKDPTVKASYSTNYTEKELKDIESRLQTQLRNLTNRLISQKIINFFSKSPSLKEAEKLLTGFKERFRFWGYHEKGKERHFVFFDEINETMKLEKETHKLLDRLLTYCQEQDSPSLKVDKPYIESLGKAFKKKYPDLALKMQKTKEELTRFLSDTRVITIFNHIPSVEDKLFIVAILEPVAFSWYREIEKIGHYITLSSQTPEIERNTTPGPKSIANKCIIPLVLHLKKCFNCLEQCTHRHHPSVYRCIGDLFNACEMEGKTDWNLGRIKERYKTIKKDPSFNEKWVQFHYRDRLAFNSNFHKKTGLFELIQRY